MKIVFATDIYFPLVGGIQVVVRRLAVKLSNLGNKVYIIAPAAGAGDYTYREGKVIVYSLASLPVPFYSSFRYIPYFLTKGKVFRLLNKISPDVVHLETNLSIAKSARVFADRYNVPLVATGHVTNDEVIFAFKNFRIISSLLGRVMAGLYKDVWKNADIVTSPSHATAEYFKKFVPVRKDILPVSNGIDIKKFTSGVKKRNSKPLIIYVGRLDPVKHVETIIKAMPGILERIDAELVLVGSGTESGMLKSLAIKLEIEKKVTFAGFLGESRVIDYLKRADVFVISSAIETQGIAVLEAMASGLPIVASNVGALPELVRPGVNGFLFPYDDYHSLANYVVKILSNKNLAKKMGGESLKIAKEHNIDKVIYKMIDLYKKAISYK